MQQRLPKLIDALALYEALKTFDHGLRLLDCTFLPRPRVTPEIFHQKFYAKFEEQAKTDASFKESYALFLQGHIPGAVHFNLGLATFPSNYDKFAYYPAKDFEEYAQLLGLNTEDNLLLYGRGPFGGMLFASRVYWLFKSYGHAGGLSLLNGGFDAWLEHKFPFEVGDEMDPPFPQTRGNWKAKMEPSKSKHTITFEELTTNDGKQLNMQQILLDARPAAQFEGSHLPGALNIPSTDLVDSTGKLRSGQDIRALAKNGGLDIEALEQDKSKPLVTLCNMGMQASLLAAAMDIQLDLSDHLRVYNGSLSEIQARAPELISECDGQNKENCTPKVGGN